MLYITVFTTWGSSLITHGGSPSSKYRQLERRIAEHAPALKQNHNWFMFSLCWYIYLGNLQPVGKDNQSWFIFKGRRLAADKMHFH